MTKYIKISELSRSLNLVDKKTKKPLNHVLRFWEKQFKEIKPLLIKNRRYYSEKQIILIKSIKFLLKDKGLTISGVKNILNSKINSLDEHDSIGLKSDYQKHKIKVKSKVLLEKIKKLKSYGKKISHKS